MIDDFKDQNGNIISLKGKNRSEALAYLVAHDIPLDLAENHVSSSLERSHCRRVSPSEIYAEFEKSGRTSVNLGRNIDFYRWKYDYFSSESLPSNYIIQLVTFSVNRYGMDSVAILSFSCWNYFTLQLLRETLFSKGKLFPQGSCFHDQMDAYSGSSDKIVIWFSDPEMLTIEILNLVFNKIRGIILYHQNQTAEQLEVFENIYSQCIKFAKNFIKAQQNNFPAGNLYTQTYLNKTRVLEDQLLNERTEELPHAKDLYESIIKRNARQVESILRTCNEAPNFLYQTPIIVYAFPRADQVENAAKEDILAIFSWLLEFDLTIGYGFNYGTAMATLIMRYMDNSHENPQQARIYIEMICMLMRLDGGRTYNYFNYSSFSPSASSFFPTLIRSGQGVNLSNVKTATVKQGNLFQAALGEKKNRQTLNAKFCDLKYQRFDDNVAVNSIKYFIRQKTLNKVLQDLNLRWEMYNLFKSSEPWKSKLEKNELSPSTLQSSWHEILENNAGPAYVDLVQDQNDELKAFCISQLVKCVNENVIFHHIKLCVADPSLKTLAPGLMYYLTYRIGYSLKLGATPNLNIITVFEAASASSILQVHHFDHYPKKLHLETYMELLKNTIYKGMSLKKDCALELWRLEDPVAAFKKVSPNETFPLRSGLIANRLFGHGIFKNRGWLRDKRSLIVLLNWNQKNSQIYLQQLKQFFSPLDARLFSTLDDCLIDNRSKLTSKL